MSTIKPNGGGVTPGATVIVNVGRYWLCHGVVTDVLPDLGSHGFARLRFFGRSGRPLARQGLHWDTDAPMTPEDLVPVQALNVVEAEPA